MSSSKTSVLSATALAGLALAGVLAMAGGALADDNPALVAAPDAFTTPIGRSLTFNPLVNDPHTGGGTLSITGLTSPAHGEATLAGGATVTYAPQVGYEGIDAFDYTVSDGAGNSATGTVSVNVAAMNVPPMAADDAFDLTGAAGEPHVLSVLSNDTDADSDTLTIVDVSTPSNGAVSAVSGGGIQISNLSPGASNFTYTISDGHGGFATANVMVNWADPQ